MTLAGLAVDVVVEIGPASMTDNAIGDAWPADSEAPVLLATLGNPSDDVDSPELDEGFLRAVTGVYQAGLDISFTGLFASETRRRISIPTYPFQRRRHWF